MVSGARGFVVGLVWLCAVVGSDLTSPNSSRTTDSVQPEDAAGRAARGSPLVVANETVLRARSPRSGQVTFPGSEEGRHAASSSRPLWHQVLYGTASPDRYTPAISRAVCQLYPDAGSCSGDVIAWYWDSSVEKCKTFRYGGCKGNGNNFITENECRTVCDIGYRQKVTGSTDYLPRPSSDSYSSRPDSDSYGSRPVSSQYYPASSSASGYRPRPSAADRPAFPARPYAQLEPISDRPYPQLEPIGDRPYPQLESIGEVDLNGLSVPGQGTGSQPPALLQRPASCADSAPFCAQDSGDYPSSAVNLIVDRYRHELKQMYQDLYHHAPEDYLLHENATRDDVRGRSAIESLSARHGPGEFVCESEVHYSRPGWARSFAGLWQLVINTPSYPQAVRTERCRYEGRRCNYLPPCMSSVCVQRFAVVKMLCVNPLNPFARPRVQDVEIPSGCSCYVTGDRSDIWREPWVRSGHAGRGD